MVQGRRIKETRNDRKAFGSEEKGVRAIWSTGTGRLDCTRGGGCNAGAVLSFRTSSHMLVMSQLFNIICMVLGANFSFVFLTVVFN